MVYAYELKERGSTRKRAGAHMPIPDASLWQEASKYLEARHLSGSLAAENRWYASRQAGDDAPRIVIPCTNQSGLAYWQARLIDSPDAVERPRYTSPAVPRGDSIVVVWPFRSLVSSVAIVEGAMDALAAAGEGVAGVALMGNHPAPEAFEIICRLFPAERLVVIPDMDSLREAVGWLCALASLGRRAEVILPAPDKDLAAAAPARRALLLRSVTQ
jgi:hypothetical protein